MSDSNPPRRSTYFHRRPKLAIYVIFFSLCLLNPLSQWLIRAESMSALRAIVIGVWIMEPMLLSAWSVLGTGYIVTRLPMTTICLALLVVQLAYVESRVHNMARYEFVTLLAVVFGIYLITILIFGLVRWFSGLRIGEGPPQPIPATRVQFRVSFLLMFTTLVAGALAMFKNLTFGEPPPNIPFFGPSFVVAVLAYGSSFCFVAELPVLAIALLALRSTWSRKALQILIGVWAIVTIGFVILLIAMENEWRWDTLVIIPIQVGGAACALFAALLLRASGYRLCGAPDSEVATSFRGVNPNESLV